MKPPSEVSSRAHKPAGRAPRRPRSADEVHQSAPAAPPVESESVVALGDTLSIREVSGCRSRLRAAIEFGALTVDAGSLQTVDTAGVQLLLAAAQAVRLQGGRMKILGTAKLLEAAATSLGLAQVLAGTAEMLP